LGKARALRFGLPAQIAAQFGAHDLSDCALYTPAIQAALPLIRAWLNACDIAPYDIATRQGELKYLILSEGAEQQLMLRLVLRSLRAKPALQNALPALQQQISTLRVASINLQAIHQAILEGPEEHLLSAQDALPLQLNDLTLWLSPQSFFQTNTRIAALLYQRARQWAQELTARQRLRSAWDLYCGVGGFGLHLAPHVDSLHGIECSAAAITNAKRAARQLHNTQWIAADALEFSRAQLHWPDLLLVNPPRRGIGAELCELINRSDARAVIYSSCNPHSLAQDLRGLSAYRVRRAQLFDMFPNTSHLEVLVLAERDAHRSHAQAAPPAPESG
jgi:23S rRNA (uracil747-C5)-methyltransferase